MFFWISCSNGFVLDMSEDKKEDTTKKDVDMDDVKSDPSSSSTTTGTCLHQIVV